MDLFFSPLWGQGVTNTLELTSLPASSPHPLSIPGSLEPSWSLRKPPACSPCSPFPLSIPGSLEPSWGFRKPPVCSPCSQLAPLSPWASLSPWNLPGVSRSPKLPAHFPCSSCSPCPLSIPGSLEPSWGLRKPPACSSCFQRAPLAPSLLPLAPEHPWIPGTFLVPQKVPSLLPAHSPCSQLAPLTPNGPSRVRG